MTQPPALLPVPPKHLKFRPLMTATPVALLLGCLGASMPDSALAAAPAAAPAFRLEHSADLRDNNARQFQVNLSKSEAITVTCDEVGGSSERHVKESGASLTHTMALRGLKASTRYTCAARTASGNVSSPVEFITAPLPADLRPPKITVPSTNLPDTGYTLYDRAFLGRGWSISANYLVILDAEGNVRWYYSGVGGGIDASYLGSDKILFGGFDKAYFQPTVVGLDKQIQFQAANSAETPYEVSNSWNHDVGLSDDGLSLFAITSESYDGWTGYTLRQIDLATNTVEWSWSSIEDGLMVGELPPGSSQKKDPYHANSLWESWENGRLYLYVSMYQQFEVIKIDYETKEVVWHLGADGDFKLLESDGSPASAARWFSVQHDAKLHGNILSLYDNGYHSNNGGTDYSRALKLELNQQAMTARIVFEYTEDQWLEGCCGGYDPLPSGNSLIAMAHSWQWAVYPDKPSALVEVNPAGTVVWRADFPSKKDFIYRAERIGGCAIFNNTKYCPGN